MARDHARMQTALWGPESDFRTLTMEAQWAYQMLCQQDALTYAGVLDYRPGRLSVLAKNSTPRKIEHAIEQLRQARYVVLDQVTEELVVRSYVRHDGVMDRVNMGKAVGRALAKVVSTEIHTVIITELARLYTDEPHKAGFTGLGEFCPDVMTKVLAMTSTIPFPIQSRKA